MQMILSSLASDLLFGALVGLGLYFSLNEGLAEF